VLPHPRNTEPPRTGQPPAPTAAASRARRPPTFARALPAPARAEADGGLLWAVCEALSNHVCRQRAPRPPLDTATDGGDGGRPAPGVAGRGTDPLHLFIRFLRTGSFGGRGKMAAQVATAWLAESASGRGRWRAIVPSTLVVVSNSVVLSPVSHTNDSEPE